MTKTLLAAIAAFALVLGTAGIAAADGDIDSNHNSVGDTEVEFGHDSIDHKNAVSVNALQQVSTGNITLNDHSELDGEHLASDGMSFGHSTFENQLLDVNNFAQGINVAQQGAVSIAVQGNFGTDNDD